MDPGKTVVVMIEFQHDFVKPGGARHDAVRGVMESTGMLFNSLKLAKEARAMGATIMLTPITFAEGHRAIERDASTYARNTQPFESAVMPTRQILHLSGNGG